MATGGWAWRRRLKIVEVHVSAKVLLPQVTQPALEAGHGVVA